MRNDKTLEISKELFEKIFNNLSEGGLDNIEYISNDFDCYIIIICKGYSFKIDITPA